MQCVYCNKRNETLTKREEIVWQREDIVNVREKELREKELILEEKRSKQNEENKQLKCEIEKLLKLFRSNSSQEKSRKYSPVDTEECTASALLENDSVESDFGFGQERLMHEKEKVISEKVRSLDIWEQELRMKEQLLNDKKKIAEQERQLSFERNISIKDREKGVDTKLKGLLEKKRALDNREKLLIQKEIALSSAAAIMSDKENILHNRESSIIDKERNLVKSICEFVSNTRSEESEQSVKQLEEVFKYVDKIFNNKLSSLQQRENAVSQSEEILVERWNKYFEAQALLQAQEKKTFAVSNICANEKLMQKEWWPEKQDENVNKSFNFLDTVYAEESYKALLMNDYETPIWNFPSSIQTEPHTRNSSFLHILSKESESCSVNEVLENAGKVAAFSDVKLNSQHSVDEFFQFYEKGKEELHNVLLSKGTEEVTQGISNGCTKDQSLIPLEAPVQAFFERVFSNTTPTECENLLTMCPVSQMNNDTDMLSKDTPETTKDNDILHREQSKTNVVDSQEPSNASSGFVFVNENSLPSHDELESEKNICFLPQRKDETGKLPIDSLEIVKEDVGLQEETQRNAVVVDIQKLSNVPGGSTFVSKDITSYNDIEDQQAVCSLPQIHVGTNKLPIEAPNTVQRDNDSLQEETKSNAVLVDSQKCHDVACGSALVHKDSLSSETFVSLPVRQRDENSLSSGALLNGRLQSVERNGQEETVNKKLEISKDSVNVESCNSSEVNVPEQHENSSRREMSNNEKVSVKIKEHSISSSPKNECISPDSSVDSRRSSVSSSGGRYSPFSVKRPSSVKRPARDALLQAIANNNYLATVQLLNMKCVPLELRDDEGRSAFLLAVQMGSIDLLQRLIDKGGDVRACDYKGNSALHIAVREDNLEMVIFLLERGLSPHVTDINGLSAVQLASQLNKECFMDVLNQNDISAK